MVKRKRVRWKEGGEEGERVIRWTKRNRGGQGEDREMGGSVQILRKK
jgi:hypothetical protein